LNTIHFNDGAINLARPLTILRAAARYPDELRIICTGARRRPGVARLSDRFELEPQGLDDASYVEWCLGTARRHGIDLLYPGRHAVALVAARGKFERAGVRLLSVADAPTLKLLMNKAATYRRLSSLPVNIPDYAVARDAASFDEALAKLEHHALICSKPTVSVYGLGFKILTRTDRRPCVHRDLEVVTIEAARRRFAQKAAAGEAPETVVMEYLPGPERSVDCLAEHGLLLRTVVRRKSSREGVGQRIERHPQIEEMVRQITADLRLHGVFNVQFRDARGKPYLLEINARMSGGLRHSYQAGVALPYWAIRLALGTATPDDVPYPQIGLRVGQFETLTSH
jgi:phosphoribosylamine-glycine ligase